MSIRTDIIIIASMCDHNLDKKFSKFNARGVGQFLRIDHVIPESVGLSVYVYAGNFDSRLIDPDELRKFLSRIKWNNPDCVQIMIKEEGNDTFQEYNPQTVFKG